MENTEEVKNPEVELDTDGVKDQTLEVEEQKVETSEPELPKQEVDLGYTEPKPEGIEGITVETVKEEPKKEIKEDSLSDVSEKVKRRIDKLTFKIRESERREKAALDYAKGLKNQLDDTKNRFSKTSKSYIEQFSARVVAEQEDAKKALRDAIADQDADKIAEANSRIAQLAVEAEKVKMTQAEEEAKEEKAKAEAKIEQPIQQAPQTNVAQPSGKAKEWAEKNEWFGKDMAMTNTAISMHKILTDEEGYDPQSDEYYEEINKRIRLEFPHKFANVDSQTTQKPTQVVASANRSSRPGRKTVRLTSSQVAIAKKLGVPLEEYAKQLNITKE